MVLAFVTYYFNGKNQKWKCHKTLEKAITYKDNIEKQNNRISVYIALDINRKTLSQHRKTK